MSDGPETPPALPHERSGGKLSPTLAWIIIIASVVFLAWTANHPPEEETQSADAAEQGLITAKEANELAMLKIQSRLIIGVAQLNRAEAIRSVKQLDEIATTPRGMAAVALVQNFIDPKNGLANSLETLSEIEVTEPSAVAVKNRIELALKNGASEKERDDLKKHIGWFSGLLPSSDDSDFGAEIRSEAVSSIAIFGVASVVVFLAFLTGLTLLIVFFVSLANGKAKMRYQPGELPSRKHLFLEAFAFYIGIMALGHLLGTLITPLISMAAYVVSFVLALFWPKIRGLSWKQTRELIGWNRGTGFFKEVGAGIVGYLGIIVIAFIGLVMTLLLIAVVNMIQGGTTPASGAGASHPIVGMLDSTNSLVGKLSLLFFAAGVAPFLEETMFRGSFFRYLRHHSGFILSSVLGGIIFAIIHPQGIFALPALTAMGIGFALLREWRDSLIASMTAHALNNGMIVGLLMMVMG